MIRKISKKGYRTYANYKENAMLAAQELGYGPEVVKKIINAKSDHEIERIMATARNEERN